MTTDYMNLARLSYSETNLRTRLPITEREGHNENWNKKSGTELATAKKRSQRFRFFKDVITFLLVRQSVRTVFVIAILTYVNTLRGTFLHDDNPAILRNPDVQGKTELYEVFKSDFWGTSMQSYTSHKSYRPLCVLTFRFEHYMFGFSSIIFHLSNIVLHASVSVMFLLLCKRFVFQSGKNGNNQEKDRAAGLCGLLFALHPIHVEAVAGIVGRAELLSAVFYLASLSFYLQYATLDRRKQNNGKEGTTFDYIGKTNAFAKSLALASLSMLCKETGITVLGIIASIETLKVYNCFIWKRNKEKRAIYKSLTQLFAILCWGLVLLLFRFSIMGWRQPVFAKPDNPASQSSNFRTRLLTYSYLWFVNLKLLLWPGQMLYDWSYGTIPLITSWTDTRNLTTLFTIVSAILLSFSIFYNNKLSINLSPSLFGLIMLVFPFLPSSNLFFPVGFVVAERVLYIPSMGFVILYVALYRNLCQIFPNVKSCFDIFLLITVIYYTVNTSGRNQNWLSKEKLFSSALDVAPNNAKVRYNWANFLRDSGQYHEAAKEYQKTLDLYPMYAGALNNLATILEMNPKTWSRAEELYMRLIRVEPGRSDAYRNLADLLMKQKRYDRAVDVYSRLLDIHGSSVDHVISLADLFWSHDKLIQAERLYARVITHHCDVRKDIDLLNLIHRVTFTDVTISTRTENCLKSAKHMQAVFARYQKILLLTNRIDEYEELSRRYVLFSE